MTDDLTALRAAGEATQEIDTLTEWYSKHDLLSSMDIEAVDAEFIAAANPSVVLALLDRLERAEAAIAHLKEWLEENRPLRCTIDYASEGGAQDDYSAIMAVLAALDTGKEPGEWRK